MAETPNPRVKQFSETAALWAVMNDDSAELRRIALDLLPGERTEFAEQLDKVRAALGDTCTGCGQMTPPALIVTLNPLSPQRRDRCRDCAAKELAEDRGRSSQQDCPS